MDKYGVDNFKFPVFYNFTEPLSIQRGNKFWGYLCLTLIIVSLLFSSLQKNFDGNLKELVKLVFPEHTIKFIRQIMKKPVIFTLRRKDQGGYCEIPENLRIGMIKYLMNFRPDYFDLEYDIEPKKLTELNALSKKIGCKYNIFPS